jgi:tRNA G10  N-methylase Trm11
MESIFILGRQPAIGRAELESIYGADHLQPIGESVILSDLPVADIDFARLGSSVKMGAYLGVIRKANMPTLHTQLEKLVLQRAESISEGKIQLGISAYGVKTNPKQLVAIGLNLKKALRNKGYSVRLTPNQDIELSSAQVLHNHLAGPRGIELLLIRHESDIIVAQTTAVQDITAYAKRDQERPKRDAFVGMLPPKLAQTIINLGVGDKKPSHDTIILDPFCGTGVVLQEALLMGYGTYGTDLETRMIDYSAKNLEWLHEKYQTPTDVPLEVGDATSFMWKHPFTVVACEAYLGHPLANWPRPEKLQQIIGTCNVIIEKFLRNIAQQMPAGSRLCVAVPAWINPNGRIHHLPALDHLEKMGYNRVSFMHAGEAEMVYYRSDQTVARELLVITRK